MIKKINIEKITEYNYFLLIASFIFFVDSYFIFFLDLSIKNININIVTANIGHILILLFLYSFVMSIMSKLINWIVNAIYEYKFKNNTTVDRTNYIFSDDALYLSIEKNNSVLYNYYLDNKKTVELIYHNQYLSTALIIILIVNILVSNDTNSSLIKIYELFLNDTQWYNSLINVIPIGTIIYVSYSILNIGELYYIYVPKELHNTLLNKEIINASSK